MPSPLPSTETITTRILMGFLSRMMRLSWGISADASRLCTMPQICINLESNHLRQQRLLGLVMERVPRNKNNKSQDETAGERGKENIAASTTGTRRSHSPSHFRRGKSTIAALLLLTPHGEKKNCGIYCGIYLRSHKKQSLVT